jgi:hypothetical protein
MPRPATISAALTINIMLLTAQTSLLIVHFSEEAMYLGPSCHKANATFLFELALGLTLLQAGLPALLLVKIASGRIWACFAYVAIFIASDIWLAQRWAFTGILGKIYQLSNLSLIMSCILFFLPISYRWFNGCRSAYSREAKRPWLIVIGLILNTVFLFAQISLNNIGIMVSSLMKSLAIVGGHVVENCAPAPATLCCVWAESDFTSLWLFFLSIPIQAPIQIFLMFQIAFGKVWSRNAYYAVLAISIIGYLISFVRNTEAENPPAATFDLIAMGLMCLASVLFILPASNRWYKLRAA